MTVTCDRRRDIQRDSRETFAVSNGTPSRPVPSPSIPWSPSIHSVTQVTREAAPEQRAQSGVEWMEGIDFEAEVPCRGPYQRLNGCPTDSLADFIVASCNGVRAPLCQTCREGSGWCEANSRNEPRREHFVIVEVLR